jgi:hypothetical protein
MDDREELYKKMLTLERNGDQHVSVCKSEYINKGNVSHERIVKNISEICKMIKRRVNIINNHKYVTIHYGEDKTKERNFIEESESIWFLF